MAPELFSTETVSAADGTTSAQNGQKETKKLGAVFFDMDDTLVLTHEADSQAFLAVMAIVAERAPQVDQSAVLRDFQERWKNEPWDPEQKVLPSHISVCLCALFTISPANVLRSTDSADL